MRFGDCGGQFCVGYMKNMVYERNVDGRKEWTTSTYFLMLQDALMTPQLIVTLHFT